jgi:hypothetical protein
MMTEPPARVHRYLGGVVCLAALVRVALLPRMALLQPDGCYYVWIAEDLARGDFAAALAGSKPPLFPAKEWLQKLRDRKILVRWFSAPEVSDYLRITIGTAAEANALVRVARMILKPAA